MEKGPPGIDSSQLSTVGVLRMKDSGSLLTSNMDLSALIQGTVKCRKGKPPSTKQTKREAFDCYMKIIYGRTFNTEIDWEDTPDPYMFSFYPEPNNNKPCSLPPLKEAIPADPKVIIPVVVENKKLQGKKFLAPSSKPKIEMKVKPQPVERVEPKIEEPVETLSPTEQDKPKTPGPPTPHPRTPEPPPARVPTPEMPTFLKQFADADWFKDLFPDEASISISLSPEDLSLQLLGYLSTCSNPSKMKIIAALHSLHSQGLLHNTDKLYQGLIDLVPKFATPHMPPLQRTVLVELLNFLMGLKYAGYVLVKKLLTLLAFKQLFLQDTVMRMLTALGIDEAEQWLRPEVESWDSELRDQSDIWKNLQNRADCWLQLWTSKYKCQQENLRSTAKWKPSSFSMVDVLNYFCSVQKEEDRKARYVAPVGDKNTVLLPLYDKSQAIFRLGETYSMSRIRRPPGIILPPLRNRPFLAHFPNFISFPLTRVTLRPFHIYSDDDWLKASTRRYFILQQSFVEYYR